MSDIKERVNGMLIGVFLCFVLFFFIAVHHGTKDQREEEVRQSYVCLEKEETGRCLVGVVKTPAGWILEKVAE